MPGRGSWIVIGASAVVVAVVAGVVGWPHLQRYVGAAPPRQIDQPIEVSLPAGPTALGIAHNAGNNLGTLAEAVRSHADAVEIDVIAARGQLVAGREWQPWPALARQVFRGPSLEEAWDAAAGVDLLKLDLKQSDRAFLDQVVAFLAPRAGSRAVLVSSPDRAALLRLHDRLPALPLAYSAGNPDAVERLESDPVLAADVAAISTFHGLVDARLIRWAHARGLQVIAWTVDGGRRLAHLVQVGVDGVTTANLAVLRALGG